MLGREPAKTQTLFSVTLVTFVLLGGLVSCASNTEDSSINSGVEGTGGVPSGCPVLTKGCPRYVCICDDLTTTASISSNPGHEGEACYPGMVVCAFKCSTPGLAGFRTPRRLASARCISQEEYEIGQDSYPPGRHPGETCNPESLVNGGTCVTTQWTRIQCPDGRMPSLAGSRGCPSSTRVCPSLDQITAEVCSKSPP
jgi:hypothetical protein